MQPIRTSAITEDFAFSVEGDKIIYARYVPHPLSPEVNLTETHEVSVTSGIESRLTPVTSLYRPAFHNGLLTGIRHVGLQTSLVTINAEGEVVEEMSWNEVRIIDYLWDEGQDSFLVLAAYAGRQAMYYIRNT